MGLASLSFILTAEDDERERNYSSEESEQSDDDDEGEEEEGEDNIDDLSDLKNVFHSDYENVVNKG
jgi:hypothetical protein